MGMTIQDRAEAYAKNEICDFIITREQLKNAYIAGASESPSKGMKERYEEALEAQGKYILFLTHHYNNMYGLAAVHGFVCSDEEIKKGELLRKEIYNQQILVQKEIESVPSNPVVDEGWISECKEVIELLLKRNRELYSFADMPWEDYSGQNAVVRGKEFVNRLPKPPNT